MARERSGVIPMLSYQDGVAALEWLAKAFGFRERTRLQAPDGQLTHAEMTAGGGVIMLATPTRDYESPRRHRQHCERARRWSIIPVIVDGVQVHVDDVDEHCARARAAGATILSDPEEGPAGRRYRVEDLEGHRWMFVERASPGSRRGPSGSPTASRRRRRPGARPGS